MVDDEGKTECGKIDLSELDVAVHDQMAHKALKIFES